jgi:DNA repair protein RecN (Recombination protein N)
LQALAAEAELQHAQREAQRAELQEQVALLDKLAPAAGEWERLAAEHQRLAHGSSLLAGAQSSLETLSEAEGASLPQLAAVTARLRELSAHDAGLREIVELLESAGAQAGEAARASSSTRRRCARPKPGSRRCTAPRAACACARRSSPASPKRSARG